MGSDITGAGRLPIMPVPSPFLLHSDWRMVCWEFRRLVYTNPIVSVVLSLVHYDGRSKASSL
jgi:hypothetical protein